MKKELVKMNQDTQLTVEEITKYLCPTATPKEAGLFLKICQTNNLNPFKKEAYLIKYGSTVEMVTGYEVYIKRAERAKNYGGFNCWVEGSLKDANLKACIEIYRKDWDKPFYHEVYIEECTKGTAIWKKRPKGQLKKVAISQAFRLVWPEDLGGLPYSGEEIQSDTVYAESETQTSFTVEAIQEETTKGETQEFTGGATPTKEDLANEEREYKEGKEEQAAVEEAEKRTPEIKMSTLPQQQKIHIQAGELWGKDGKTKLKANLKKFGWSESTKELTLKQAHTLIEKFDDIIKKVAEKKENDKATEEKVKKEAELKEEMTKPKRKPVRETDEFGKVLNSVISGADKRGDKFLHDEVGMPLEGKDDANNV